MGRNETLSFPHLRSFVKLELCHAIQEHFPEAEAVIEEAAKTGYIKEEDKAVLAEWRKSPETWKQ